MDAAALKQAARREVEQIAPGLTATSDWMADNPEIGLQEHRAAERLSDMLAEFGAEVERGIAGMPTAFVARLPGGRPGPRVAIVAEYDALPGVGHGAGIALARLGLGGGLPGVEWREYMPPYLNMLPSESLGASFAANLTELGRPMAVRRGHDGAGSTDFDNVSHRVPTICAMLKICGKEAGWHSPEVAAATRTPAGHAAIDVLLDAALRERAARDHAAQLEEAR